MIIPVFARCPVEKLAEEWELDIPDCEWVEAVIPHYDGSKHTYETQRFDFTFWDIYTRATLKCYFYYDEHKTTLLGIDSVVLDHDTGDKYPFIETPFYSIFGWLTRNY
jgi:hypothetical protein